MNPKDTRIIIIDDWEEQIDRLKRALNDLGYTNLQTCLFDYDEFIEASFSIEGYIPLSPNSIVLLDEGLSSDNLYTGTDLRKDILKEIPFAGTLTFASISGDKCPGWAEHHFGLKARLGMPDVVTKFEQFMLSL